MNKYPNTAVQKGKPKINDYDNDDCYKTILNLSANKNISTIHNYSQQNWETLVIWYVELHKKNHEYDKQTILEIELFFI